MDRGSKVLSWFWLMGMAVLIRSPATSSRPRRCSILGQRTISRRTFLPSDWGWDGSQFLERCLGERARGAHFLTQANRRKTVGRRSISGGVCFFQCWMVCVRIISRVGSGLGHGEPRSGLAGGKDGVEHCPVAIGGFDENLRLGRFRDSLSSRASALVRSAALAGR